MKVEDFLDPLILNLSRELDRVRQDIEEGAQVLKLEALPAPSIALVTSIREKLRTREKHLSLRLMELVGT